MSKKAHTPTCATCKFIGQAYWGSSCDYGGRTHFCLKEKERRSEAMKPTGDFAEDFMRNFRTFFDAGALSAACKHYVERESLDPEKLAVLEAMAGTGGKAAFAFFSEGNRLCEAMSGLFVERDEHASRQRKPSDGTRDFMLTSVGFEFLKARATLSKARAEA